jgi:uncharacterized protein (TIGR02147 family)
MRLIEADNLKQAVDRLRTSSLRPLSIRQLSQKLGYSSDRALGMVLQGKRPMSHDMLERVRKWARLTKKESEFLHLLARRERKAKAGLVDSEIENEILRLRQRSHREKKISGHDLEALTPWFAFALLEALKFFAAPVRAEDLAKKLRGDVALEDVVTCLKGLAELGFLVKENELYSRRLSADEHLVTPIDVPSKLARLTHRRQLQRAAEALEEQSVLEREFCAKTFVIAASQVDKMKKRIRELAEELESEFIQNTPSSEARAVQLNLQFYLQTR